VPHDLIPAPEVLDLGHGVRAPGPKTWPVADIRKAQLGTAAGVAIAVVMAVVMARGGTPLAWLMVAGAVAEAGLFAYLTRRIHAARTGR
jgi:hypothetical protein